VTVPVRPDRGGERHPGTVHRPPVHGACGQLGLERGVLTRRTGMHLPPQLPLAAWERIGRQMYVIADSSAWWWGDWLVFGADRYPDRYRRAIAETSLDYQTLRNYAWIARRFAMPRRRDSLSFQHHVVVAPLSDAEQDRWLTRAEENRWSRNELRRRLRGEQQPTGTGPAPAAYRLNVDSERQERWRQAASRADSSLTDWIVACLDRAADALLVPGSTGES
jgi:hypothetical protein